MVDENRLKSMIRLAAYEDGIGRRDIDIHRYSRRDFMALEFVRTFFCTTIGFLLLLVLVIFGNMDFFMSNMTRLDIGTLLILITACYVALLVFYMTVGGVKAWDRYHQADRSVRAYRAELKRLDRLYRRKKS